MKITMEFTMPEDRVAYEIASHAAGLEDVVVAINNHIQDGLLALGSCRAAENKKIGDEELYLNHNPDMSGVKDAAPNVAIAAAKVEIEKIDVAVNVLDDLLLVLRRKAAMDGVSFVLEGGR